MPFKRPYKTLFILLALSLTVAIAAVSCGREGADGSRLGANVGDAADSLYISDTLESLIAQWSRYRSAGRQDSVIIMTMPWFYHFVSSDDTIGVQYTGISIAQAYVLLDESYDLTKQFIDRIRPYFEKISSPNVASMYWTTLGHFALKYELDYSEALQCYLNAMEATRALGSVSRQIVTLCNIVNIFYIRSDHHGMKYAEEALELSRTDTSINAFSKIAANLAMAQMLYLSEKPHEALESLQKAHIMSLSENVTYYDPILQLLYGDIFSVLKDFDRAEACYSQALAVSSNTEPSTITLIYLNYGKMYELADKYDKAIELYLKGLKVSSSTHNMEFRKELLWRLSQLLYDIGRDNLAVSYYRQYTEFLDDFSLEDKEQELTGKLLSYSEMRHEYETALRDLELSESKRRLYTSAFVILVVSILAAVAFFLYVRQRKITKDTVKRYEEYRRRLLSENRKQDAITGNNAGAVSQVQEAGMEKLYLKIEELMRGGAYRDKELSLDRMASMLGSNRTYVSNTINKMAGTTFYKYLDTYRIKEATRVLSDPHLSDAVSLKSLADDIGYNSPQVFHKAFKKETGVTPNVYKSEIRKMNADENDE